MKKNYKGILLLFLTLFFNCLLCAQEVTQSKDGVLKLLCNYNWKLDYAMINEARMSLPAKIEMRFNEDGSYSTSMNEETINGSWVFNDEKKYIGIVIKKNGARIIKLSEDEFIFIEQQTETRDTPNNSRFYFKRI